MHLNEVERILREALCLSKKYELKKYCDHICCESDFLLLKNGIEYAYIKFDQTSKMSKKEMNINEEKMGTAHFYIIVKDSDEFIPTNLPCKIFPRNNMKNPFECSTDVLSKTLLSYQVKTKLSITIEDVSDFFEKSFSSLIRGRMQAFVSKIREETDLSKVIEDYDAYFMLTPEYERLFFCSLLGSTSGMPKRVCRYTSLHSLFRSLSNARQSMCGIVSMNDKTETNYAKQFISNSISVSNLLQRLDARSAINQSETVSFILSGSKMGKKDDLNMWRLYGDDSKGACVWYDVEELPDNFFLAKVSYAKNNTHAELNYLAAKLSKSICGRSFEIRDLDSWMHFFKPAEYAIEEETRLLFVLKDIKQLEIYEGKWILNSDNNIITPIIMFPIGKTNNMFPLKISKIVLGPNCPERELNKKQLYSMIKSLNINTTDDFEILISNIRSYRE